MIDILTGKEVNDNVIVEERFRFVERIPSGSRIDRIFPMTIRRYIAKHANPEERGKGFMNYFRRICLRDRMR